MKRSERSCIQREPKLYSCMEGRQMRMDTGGQTTTPEHKQNENRTRAHRTENTVTHQTLKLFVVKREIAG